MSFVYKILFKQVQGSLPESRTLLSEIKFTIINSKRKPNDNQKIKHSETSETKKNWGSWGTLRQAVDMIEACRSRLLQGQCSRWYYPRCRKVLSLSELHLLFNLAVCRQAAVKNREVFDGMWAYINTITVTDETLIFLNITESG